MKTRVARCFFCWVLAVSGPFAPAIAENSERPAADWLADVRERLSRPGEPDFAGLLRSAAMTPPTKYGGMDSDLGLIADWKTGRGAPILEAVVSGKELEPGAGAYRQLAEYILLKEARDAGLSKLKTGDPTPPGKEALKAFWENSYNEGIALLRRAYPTGMLSESDIGVLRRYAMVAGLMGTSASLVPFEVRLGGNLVEVGKTAPTFVADRLEAFDVAAAVRAGNPSNVFDLATEWVLIEPLQALMSYEADGDPARVKPRPGVWPLKQPSMAFRLGEAFPKKPVALLFAHPSDFWAYHFTLAVEFDALARAAGDLADFVLVNVSVHDTVMGTDDPIPPAGQISKSSQFQQNALIHHPATIDERVRVAGLFQLALPFFSVPMVLDDMGQTIRNAYRERGGEATMVLVDRDGRVVYRDRVDIVPKTHFYKEYRWQRLQAFAARIGDLSRTGGRDPDPGSWTLPGLWKPGPLELGSDGPPMDATQARATLVVGGTIQSADAGILSLDDANATGAGMSLWEKFPDITPASQESRARLAALQGWKSTGVPSKFQILESAIVIRNGRVASRADLRAGDRVGLRTRAPWADVNPVPADMVFAFGE